MVKKKEILKSEYKSLSFNARKLVGKIIRFMNALFKKKSAPNEREETKIILDGEFDIIVGETINPNKEGWKPDVLRDELVEEEKQAFRQQIGLSPDEELLNVKEFKEKYQIEIIVAGYAVVTRLEDQVQGTMRFSDSPRYYYDFVKTL